MRDDAIIFFFLMVIFDAALECFCLPYNCRVNREGVRLTFIREIAVYTSLRAREGAAL